jgi:quercetin dioxygenase-like cupin family protein
MMRDAMSAILSHAAEQAAKRIEFDLARRLFLGGLAGSLSMFSKSSLAEQLSKEKSTTVSREGITRTIIENYANDQTGEEFKLVMTTYPPGVGLPRHHHPSVAHNYILEGIAESQYAGEELKIFKAGESYQDKGETQHEIFRNPDLNASLKYLIAYTVKKGQPYLIIP